MRNYTSQKFGLSFLYPVEWDVYEAAELGGLQIIPPPREEGEIHVSNISILVRPQNADLSSDPGLISYVANEIVKTNYENFNNCMILSLISRELSDVPARELLFTYFDEKKNVFMRAMQNVFLHKNKVFLVTYTASEDIYPSYLAEVNDIFRSLKVFSA